VRVALNGRIQGLKRDKERQAKRKQQTDPSVPVRTHQQGQRRSLGQNGLPPKLKSFKKYERKID